MTDSYNKLTEKERNDIIDKTIKEEETVNHPRHYNKHPSGIECIEIVEELNFNMGNAIKYLWRAGLKGSKEEDIRKARFYLEREVNRINKSCPYGNEFHIRLYILNFPSLWLNELTFKIQCVLEFDKHSILSSVLNALLKNKNPLEAFDNWTPSVETQK